MKKIFYISIFLVFTISNIQALLVTGDPNAAADETFSFDIGFAAFDPKSEQSAPRLWTATNQVIASDSIKPYGLSLINQLASYVGTTITPTATPMTNEENATVYTFNGTTASAISVPNPIWGAAFAFFDVSYHKPSFVLANDLSQAYLVQNIERYETQTDTEKNITELLRYDLGAGEQTDALLQFSDSLLLAHSTGGFGANPSKITEAKVETFVVSEIKDKDGQVVNKITIPYLKTIADTTIDVSTAALLGGGMHSLASLGSNVTLGYAVNRFYIGLKTTAANLAMSDRAVSLTYATASKDELAPSGYSFIFNSIAPTSVLQAANFNTVVSANQNGTVTINNIAGMTTSTGLSYLIVSRNGATAQQSIYAIPVVASGTNMGEIADFTSIKNYFGSNPALLRAREFDTVISDASQINIAGIYSQQLLVGMGITPSTTGSIQQLYTVGDSVYVVIADPYSAGTTPGTFYSQAIFAQDGHIQGWTPWQRVLGSDQKQLYSFVDNKTISGYYAAHKSTGNFRAIYQTTFVDNSSNLAPLLSQASMGGTQGLFNFPQTTSGFNNALSMLITTGFQTVNIGQTGKVVGGFFQINNPMTTNDIVSFTSAQLADQTAIIAAEIGHDTSNNHWIFVGGVKGLSVFTDDATGVTWNGNLADIDTGSLSAGQTFKKVGDFKFIKKLAWDRNSSYLYVLTSNELYRITLDPNKFTANPTTPLDPELIVTGLQLATTQVYFLDLLIDTGFCVLGTTNGLYTLNNGNNQTLQKIPMPDGLPAVSKIIPIAASLNPEKNFKNLSNLIILNNSFGTQQARINRFVVNNETITPFNDFLVASRPGSTQGLPTSFIRFDNYMSNYFTNGSWNLASTYPLGPNEPNDTNQEINLQKLSYVLQLFAGIRTGFSSSQLILPTLSSYPPLLFLAGANNLAGLINESTSGSLIIFGNFPTQANV